MATLTTARLAIPYPDGNERVMDGDNAMGAIAGHLDALATAGIPFRMAGGTATLPVNASTNGSVVVNFPASRFTVAPLVLCTSGNTSYIVGPGTPSATTVTLFAAHKDTTSTTTSFTVWWLAIQMLAGAAPG